MAIISLAVVAFIFLIVIPHNSQDLGEGYWYDKEGKRVFGQDIDVPPIAKIVECKEDYLIVEQRPKKEREEATYEREYNYPYGRDTTYFWVIYKKEHTFEGPLLFSELDSVLVTKKQQKIQR